jgi:peptide/nickel transport system substrate-binding protein
MAQVLITLAVVAVSSDALAQPARELVVGATGLPTSLDPFTDATNQGHAVYRTLFDGLTRVNDTTLAVEPALAESWSLVNRTTWLFKLRKHVRFHNGEPFDARSVEFSIRRMLDPGTRAGNRGRARTVTGVRLVDEFTVEITTATPDPTLPAGLTWWMMLPSKNFSERGAEAFAKAPVGTGPFKLESAQGDQRIVVTANADYWRGRPALDRITFRNIPEHATRAAALRAGELHLAINLPLDLIASLKAEPRLDVQAAPVISAMIVQFDLLQPGAPLKDVRVRQALNYAIDKEAIVKNLFLGYGRPLAGQVVTPEAFGYCPGVAGYAYDPAKARALLKEAGYEKGFAFKLWVPNGQYLNDAETATVVASQLAKVGVTANVQVLERGAWLDVVSNKRKEARDSYLVAWFSYGDAEYALRWGTTKSGFPYWADEAFDRAVDAGVGSFDPAERQRHYCAAAGRYRDQAPAIFLLQPPVTVGMSKNVDGFTVRADQHILLYPVRLK